MSQKPVRYLRLEPEADPPELVMPAHKVVLVVDDEVSELWQCEVSRWLVDSGCRVVMVWGADCGSWCETLNEANLEAFDYQEIPEERLLVTTSHEDEEVSEVFWFAKHRARNPVLGQGETLVPSLILHISTKDKQAELVGDYDSA